MGNPNCAKALSAKEVDAGVGPAPDLDAGEPNTAAQGQSAEINAADGGIAGCVEAQGGTTRYRPAGIASGEELEAYAEECALREQTCADDVLCGHAWLDGGTELVVDIYNIAADTASTTGRALKRTGQTAWAGLTGDEVELAAMGDENLELIEFALDGIMGGVDLAAWVVSRDGPVAKIAAMWTRQHTQSALQVRDSDRLQALVAERVGEATDDLPEALVKWLLGGQLYKRALLGVLTAVAEASSQAGLAALLKPPPVRLWLYMTLILSLNTAALCEIVSGPRRSLAAKHPDIFAFAAEHHCAFLWTWIEPQLVELANVVDVELDRVEAGDA